MCLEATLLTSFSLLVTLQKLGKSPSNSSSFANVWGVHRKNPQSRVQGGLIIHKASAHNFKTKTRCLLKVGSILRKHISLSYAPNRNEKKRKERKKSRTIRDLVCGLVLCLVACNAMYLNWIDVTRDKIRLWSVIHKIQKGFNLSGRTCVPPPKKNYGFF